MIVQDLFKDLDIEKLSNAFAKRSCILSDKRIECGKEKFDNYTQKLVNRILKTNVNRNEDYLYVIKLQDVFNGEVETIFDVAIIKKDTIINNLATIKYQSEHFDVELCKQNPISTDCIMGMAWEDILGYNFSEYSILNYDKYDVISAILYELIYFGVQGKQNKIKSNNNFTRLCKNKDEQIFDDLEDKNIEDEINDFILLNYEPAIKDYNYILNNYLLGDLNELQIQYLQGKIQMGK